MTMLFINCVFHTYLVFENQSNWDKLDGMGEMRDLSCQIHAIQRNPERVHLQKCINIKNYLTLQPTPLQKSTCLDLHLVDQQARVDVNNDQLASRR